MGVRMCVYVYGCAWLYVYVCACMYVLCVCMCVRSLFCFCVFFSCTGSDVLLTVSVTFQTAVMLQLSRVYMYQFVRSRCFVSLSSGHVWWSSLFHAANLLSIFLFILLNLASDRR